jgi:hypothetical protein
MSKQFLSIRSSLLHESVEVRAAGIRAFRYFVQDTAHVQHFYRLNLDFLIVRSVDIVLDNKAERMQALRLIRKLMSINANNFSPSLTRCLIAIAKDGHQKDDKDVILRTCLATLSELLLLNPILCFHCRVIPALMDALLNASHSPLVIEAVLGSILHTLNDADLRSKSSHQLTLHKFITPFTEYPYIGPSATGGYAGRFGGPATDLLIDIPEIKDTRLITTRFILLSLFRSWPGFLYMCSQPANHIHADQAKKVPSTSTDPLQCDSTDKIEQSPALGSLSTLHCLLSMLQMPFEDTRRLLIEFFFELFYLPLPEWTDDFEKARVSIASLTNVPDQWALYDGFVAAEAKNLLPSLSTSQNLLENHLSLMLHVFIRADLLSTLNTIIIDSTCVQNSVRCTLLLGELLYLCSRFLPAELSQRCHGLAPLLHACVATDRTSQQRAIASAAVSCLQRMHTLQKRPLNVHSIYLELLLQQQTQVANSTLFAHSASPVPRPMSSAFFPASDRPSKFPVSSSSGKLSAVVISSETAPSDNQASANVSSAPNTPIVSPTSPSSPPPPPPPTTHRRSLLASAARDHDDSAVLSAIRRSQTLIREPNDWDWQLICTLLRWPGDTLRRQEDSTQRLFVRRLVQFYKPNSRQFSALNNNHVQSRHMILAGMYLLRFLLDADDAKCGEVLQDLLFDLHQSLAQVATDNPPPSAVLSGSRLLSSHAAHYFLFIGQLSSCNRGRKILEKHGFYELLLQLVGSDSTSGVSLHSPSQISAANASNGGQSTLTAAGSAGGSACSIALNTHCDTFSKLIVSCLHYGPDAPFSRTLLGKVLTGSSDASRLYATNFLRVLLRLRFRDFGKWALELLVTQLADSNDQVQSTALDILQEACESPDLLDTLVALRPSVLHLGDRGVLLIAQFASSPNGLKYLQQSALLSHELARWSDGGFQLRYARFAEQLMNDTFTLHSRADDESYGRRADRSLSGVGSLGASGLGSTAMLFGVCGVGGGWRREAFTPVHLFGALAAHPGGCEVLVNERLIERLQRTCCELCCVDSSGRGQVARLRQNSVLNALKLKALIWSIGHIGSSVNGLQLFADSWLLPSMVRLTGECSILSVRAVCFYSLGLIGRTEAGRQLLSTYGWTSVRHTRHDRWPVCEQMLRGRLRAAHAPHLILPDDDGDHHQQQPQSCVSKEMKELSEQFERNANMQQSRDSIIYMDADEVDRASGLVPPSVRVQSSDNEDKQFDANESMGGYDTIDPDDSVNSTHLPEIESMDENDSLHAFELDPKKELPSERIRSSSDGPNRVVCSESDLTYRPSSSTQHPISGVAPESAVAGRSTVDRKYAALGTYSLQQRIPRPHSQTLPGKRGQRPHSQQHLSPYSVGAPRRKISEPTGCNNPSAYHSCNHPFVTSGQCTTCYSSTGSRCRTQSAFDDNDPHNRSHSESFGGSSGGVRILCFSNFALLSSNFKFYFCSEQPSADAQIKSDEQSGHVWQSSGYRSIQCRGLSTICTPAQ